MAPVKFEQVTKRYDNGFVAVRDLNLDINDGEFLVLVGPSGCGKTTSLRMLAGLEDISQGNLYIGDRRVNRLSAKDRDIAMVFQSYALYPHMSVFDNMAFSLELQGMGKTEIQQRVTTAAEQLGIEALLQRKPKQLSGGQRQRVAVGRAIVRNPAVFLMDEPLSNLDAKLRVQARAELSKLHKQLNTTFVYVTHDQVEAMTMGSRIAVMNQGILQQVDTPKNLYDHPTNTFVAGFMGSPSMNFFEGVLQDTESGLTIKTETFSLPIPKNRHNHYQEWKDQAVILGLRPEQIYHPKFVAPGIEPVTVRSQVSVIEMMGHEAIVYLNLLDHPSSNFQDQDVADHSDQFKRSEFIARIDPRAPLTPGETIEMVFDVNGIHLFDRTTKCLL